MSRAEKTMPSTTATTPEELQAELGLQRDLAAAHRGDELARVVADAEHQRNRADVAEATRRAELDRAEREASATAAAKLARMYREARDAGERTRISAHLARSGEARALRLERLRVTNLKVLGPALIGFGIWSTTGVQQGAALIMRASTGSPTWWALWILEPVLIAIVVWVIVARARLATAGGRLDRRATKTAAGCLGVSVVLNLAAAAPAANGHTFGDVLVLLAAMVAHAAGPVGAAGTAHLIGIVDESISDADPWTERGQKVPLLVELDLDAPAVRVDQAPETVAPVVEDAEPAADGDTDVDELIGELFARSVKEFANDLFAGQVPGIRAIKGRLQVGQARAQEVQVYLAGLVAH